MLSRDVWGTHGCCQFAPVVRTRTEAQPVTVWVMSVGWEELGRLVKAIEEERGATTVYCRRLRRLGWGLVHVPRPTGRRYQGYGYARTFPGYEGRFLRSHILDIGGEEAGKATAGAATATINNDKIGVPRGGMKRDGRWTTDSPKNRLR